MNYARTEDGGLAFYRNDEALFTIPKDGKLGLFYENGSGDIMGTLHKHGPAEDVLKYYQVYWKQARTERLSGMESVPYLNRAFINETLDQIIEGMEMAEVTVSDLTDEAIEEINKCIHISGYVSGLKGRLEEMMVAPAPAPGR